MKISAKSGAFARALGIVARAASRKATVPILSAVLVEAKDGVISFKATDNEMSIVLKSGATIEEEGTAAIPAKMLNDIVSQLAEGDLRIETGENGATLTTDKSSYTLRTYDPAEFPVLPEFEGEVKDSAFSIVADDLAGAIARASAAASDDETRPVLCGLFTSFTASSTSSGNSEGTGSLTMASTDSYRLALYEKGIDGGPGEDKKAVIPARALAELARLSDMADTIEVALTENQAIFKISSVVLATRLIDGNFPEYGRLLPESFAHDFEVPAQQLRESLKRANLFSGANAKASKEGSPGAPVRFAFSTEEGSLTGGRLTISSKTADTGQAIETLDATVPEGTGEFVTAFNGRYIAEGVAQILAAGAESVRIRANEPLKPIVLSPVDKSAEKQDKNDNKNADKTADKNAEGSGADQSGPGEFTYLIMPMRDQDAEEEQKKPAPKKTEKPAGTEQQTEQEPQQETEQEPQQEKEPANA